MTERIFAAGESRPWAAPSAAAKKSPAAPAGTWLRWLDPKPVLGLLAVLGLLFVFVQVVRQAVHQGDASRRAQALLAEAAWRCKALKSPLQRETCLDLYERELPADSAGVLRVVSEATASRSR